VHKNKRKKDDNECWFIVVFFGCIETKEKKTIMNIDSSSSSFGCTEIKEKKDNNERRLVIIFSGCTKTKEKRPR
jgi:hypothetical protein